MCRSTAGGLAQGREHRGPIVSMSAMDRDALLGTLPGSKVAAKAATGGWKSGWGARSGGYTTVGGLLGPGAIVAVTNLPLPRAGPPLPPLPHWKHVPAMRSRRGHDWGFMHQDRKAVNWRVGPRVRP